MNTSVNPKLLPFLDHPAPIPFAHRGGAGVFPENTLPAFKNAIDIGYKYLETDVHLTKDREVIAFHDESLERVANISEKISDLTLKELSQIKIDNYATIPTLLELLELFPEAKINIDPKSDSVVTPLIELIEKTNSISRVCIGSFSDKRLKQIHKSLGPKLCVSAGPKSVMKFLAGKYARINSRFTYHCLQVPERSGPVKVVTREFVQRAHAKGLQVHVWTIDDPDKMHELLDLGVDGLMTDEPSTLKDVLIERKTWWD